MHIIDGYKFYFGIVFDLCSYISLLFFVLSLTIFLFKKDKTVKYIFSLIGVAAALALITIAIESFIFAISYIPGSYNQFSGLFLSLAKPIIAGIFVIIISRKENALFVAIKAVSVFSSILVINSVSKCAGLLVGELTADSYYFVAIARAIPYAFLSGVVLIIKKFNISRFKHLSIEVTSIFFILSALAIAISIYQILTETHDVTMGALFCALHITLFILVAFLYFALYKINDYRHKVVNLQVKETLANAKLKYLEVDKINREEIRKIKHDLVNQFNYVDLLLEENKIEEAKKYVKELKGKHDGILSSFSCANEVVTSIINLELTKIKKSDININVKAIVPPSIPICDSDLCSLLTNILDNAFENYYSKAKEPINFQIIKQSDYIRIYCDNPYNKDKIEKKKGSGRGYGKKIIKSIAEKYMGYADFEQDDGKYICDIIINIEDKNV